MEGIKKIVETVMTVTDRATSPMTSIARASMSTASTLWKATAGVRGMVASIVSLKNASALMDIHSKFEDTQIAIAGMMHALGVSASFPQGMRDADTAMQSIMAAAAALPGEAEDYVSVFQAALPQIRESVAGGVAEWTAFSNQMTAAGITFGVSSQVIGRHVAVMLRAGRGGATQAMTTFNKLLPFMRQVEGQANITAISFNRMTQPERARILQQTMGKLQGMLDASASSMSAVRGALASSTRTVLRLATRPLFEAAKDALGRINALLMDSNGKLQRLGRPIVAAGEYLSERLIGGVKALNRLLEPTAERFRALFSQMGDNPVIKHLARIGGGVFNAVQAAAQVPAVRELAVGALARAALGPIGLLVGPLMGLSTNTALVSGTLLQLGNIVGLLVHLIQPAVMAFTTINSFLSDLIAGVLPGLLSGVYSAVGPVVTLLSMAFNGVVAVFEYMRPALSQLFEAIGSTLRTIGEIFGVAVRLFGVYFADAYQTVSTYLLPVIRWLISAISKVITALSKFWRFIARRIGRSVSESEAEYGINQQGPANAPLGGGNSLLDGLLAAISSRGKRSGSAAASTPSAQAAAQAAATQSARGGHHTHNDFRNSRFDITQNFAEGFDPDRIAVAFAADLERMSNERLQSGLEPVFAIR